VIARFSIRYRVRARVSDCVRVMISFRVVGYGYGWDYN
jgi:hypothetical protein